MESHLFIVLTILSVAVVYSGMWNIERIHRAYGHQHLSVAVCI